MKRIGAYKKSRGPNPKIGEPDTRGGFGAVGIENWILQNGGSFERAARTFVDTAKDCKSLAEFQQQYTVWDFGENHVATKSGFYPYDNFVYNLNEVGYEKMKEALSTEVEKIDQIAKIEVAPSENKIGIADIVKQDPSILYDKAYMDAIRTVIEKGKDLAGKEEHD